MENREVGLDVSLILFSLFVVFVIFVKIDIFDIFGDFDLRPGFDEE